MNTMTLPDLLRNPAPDGSRLGGDPSPDVEDALTRISDQMMKRGTLTHNDIDWDAVGEDAEFVLGQYRHINAFSAYILSRSYAQTPVEFDKSLDVAEVFVEKYWPDCHPQGDRQKRRRKAKLDEITQALIRIITRYIEFSALNDTRRERFKKLSATGRDKEIEWAVFDKEMAKAAPPPPPKPRPQTPQRQTPAPATASIATSPEGALDPRGRAELRRDVFTLATRIQRHYPDSAASYTMRGFAATLEPGSTPMPNDEGVTETQPMPASIKEKFARSLEEGPREGDLAAIEERLYNSPDWFEGQAIAMKMAEALKFDIAAQTIKQRVLNRLKAHPELNKIKYANNAPYLDEDIKAVFTAELPEAEAPKGAATGAVSLFDRMKDAYKSDGFQGLMELADQATSEADDERGEVLVKLALAKNLREAGFNNLAKSMLTEIRDVFKRQTVLESWDKSLLATIESGLKK